MINLKNIREQIISDVKKIVAKKYNAPEKEVKVSFASDDVKQMLWKKLNG